MEINYTWSLKEQKQTLRDMIYLNKGKEKGRKKNNNKKESDSVLKEI